jgi:hypothetical protein
MTTGLKHQFVFVRLLAHKAVSLDTAFEEDSLMRLFD